MDNTTKKEEETKLKIMLCSLPSPKPVIQDKAVKKTIQTLPKTKETKQVKPTINKEIKKYPKQEVKPKPIPKLKPIPIKKKIEPILKEAYLKPKNEAIQVIPKDKHEALKQAVPIVQQIDPEEPTEETLEPTESFQEKESRLAQEYINENIKKISKLLSENLHYPRSARKRNIQGKVMVKFKLSKSAKAYDIEVISSPSEILSRAAIRTIENLSGKFPSPQEELILHVPITYKLNR